jgi:hypothetical protein
VCETLKVAVQVCVCIFCNALLIMPQGYRLVLCVFQGVVWVVSTYIILISDFECCV